MRRTVLLLASAAAALVLASVTSFVLPDEQAQAAFPGVNGKIAFVSDRHGDSEIYTMNPDGSNPTQLTNDSAYEDYPAWSADGTKIAFGRYSSYTWSANFEIYVIGRHRNELRSQPDRRLEHSSTTSAGDSFGASRSIHRSA